MLSTPNDDSKSAGAGAQNDFERDEKSGQETTFAPGYFDKKIDDEIPF